MILVTGATGHVARHRLQVAVTRPHAAMGQDMAKGRRTEIEFLNGFVVREGEQVGLQARANERLVDIVKRVERGELKQDPRHITDLRLN
jgi:2-dehydropantoate 2-reductase